jgi:hypothetical protein
MFYSSNLRFTIAIIIFRYGLNNSYSDPRNQSFVIDHPIFFLAAKEERSYFFEYK